MSRSTFKVSSDKPIFNKKTKATVVISRNSMVFSVRPHRLRTKYILPLSEVAEMVIWRVSKAEAEAELASKGTLKMKRRRSRL